jgi:inosine-uridine nucleoside N-ribohydrolase
MRISHAPSCAATIVAILAAAFPCTAHEGGTAHRAQRIIIDTDMGLDDVRALFALLPGMETRINRIVVTEGSASRDKGVANLASFLDATHEVEVAVFEGARPDAAAPAWRETANALGGAPISRRPVGTPAAGGLDELRSLLAAERAEVSYLSLGPLTSAAYILSDPRALAAVDTVWIPARVNGARVSGWNLIHDLPSTERVAKEAGCIVFIDVSSAAEIDARDLFASLERTSPAGEWIGRSPAASSGGDHAFLHDELAAAILARPALIDIAEGPFRLEQTGNGFSLVPAPGGNVRLATVKNAGVVVDVLRELWSASAQHAHLDAPAIPVVDLLKTFHGHLGPYVVIGYRMGRLALEATGSEGHFGISAVVYSVLEPPRSCLIDGVQLGAGCTLGKRNIEARATDGPARAIFETDDGMRVTIALRPEAAALVARLIEEKGVEAAGMAVLDLPDDELFEIDLAPRRH